jgi:hypothetical protein
MAQANIPMLEWEDLLEVQAAKCLPVLAHQ